MAVYVWSTGAVVGTLPTNAQVAFAVINRTLSAQSGVAILWDTTTAPKTQLDRKTLALPVNAAIVATLSSILAATVTQYELEIRLPNPHMTVRAEVQGTILPVPYPPGNWFTDSDLNSNP